MKLSTSHRKGWNDMNPVFYVSMICVSYWFIFWLFFKTPIRGASGAQTLKFIILRVSHSLSKGWPHKFRAFLKWKMSVFVHFEKIKVCKGFKKITFLFWILKTSDSTNKLWERRWSDPQKIEKLFEVWIF